MSSRVGAASFSTGLVNVSFGYPAQSSVPSLDPSPTTPTLCPENATTTSTISSSVSINAEEFKHESEEQEDEPGEIDINVNNVVCSFSVHCHLDLRKLALAATHVEYRRDVGMVNMRIRKPHMTASIWSSGKITCTGATSEDEAYVGARRIARKIQRLGFQCRFCKYRIVNVLATCFLPFSIKVLEFSRANHSCCSYEPELHPGATYKISNPKATVKIFTTGSLTITAPRVQNVGSAVEMLYPLLEEYRMKEVLVDGVLRQPQLPARFREKNRKRKYAEFTAEDWAQLDEEYSGSDDDYDSSDYESDY